MPKEREIKFSSFFEAKEVGTHMDDLIRSACPSLEIQMSSWLISEGSPWCQLSRSSESPHVPPNPTFGLCGLYEIITLEKQAKGRTGVFTSHKEKSVYMNVCLHPRSTKHSGNLFDLHDSAHHLMRPDRKYCPIMEKESETQEVGMEMWGCPEAHTHTSSVFNPWGNWVDEPKNSQLPNTRDHLI